MRAWVKIGALAGALGLAFCLAPAARGQSASAAARLRQEAEGLSGYAQLIRDQEGARFAPFAVRMQAALSQTSRQADPTLWGSLQLTLGIAEAAHFQADRDYGSAAALRAADAALSVLTRENAPFDWARAQELKGFALAPLGAETHDAASDRASDAALDAALTVFTSAAYPYQYLTIRCTRMYREGARQALDPEDDAPERAVVGFTAVAPACPFQMLIGGAPGDALPGSAFSRSTALNFLVQPRMFANTPDPGYNSGAMRRALGRRQAEAMQAQYEQQMRESQRSNEETFSGRELVDSIDSERAAFLGASLAMDNLGLPPAQLRRARALRAQGDALAGPQGQSDPTNTPMWRAYAEMFDILTTAAPPDMKAPTVADPVVALMMMDPQRGLAAAKPTSGLGTIATTPGLADEAGRAMLGPSWTAMQSSDARVRTGAWQGMSGRTSDNLYAVERVAQNNAARDWMAMYARGDFGAAIDDFRRRFEGAWSPVLRQAIAGAGVAPGGRVVMLPDGASSMLPIGVLRDRATGRTLIEDYEIVFAPSLDVLALAERRAARASAPSLAAFTPTRAESGLDFVGGEIAMAGAAFGGGGRGVIDPAASKASVLSALRGASYWHFATHGAFDSANPRNSWLMLGRGQKLTLNDLYAMEETGAPRLVVLSACETGLFDVARDPNEFIGLPTGFIQAGAAGVIASLWQVSDVSTTLLMARFYELHLGNREAPSSALRHAQLWLKDADQNALQSFVRAEEARGALSRGESAQLGAAITEAGGGRPFAHPYYWGGFVYYGA